MRVDFWILHVCTHTRHDVIPFFLLEHELNLLHNGGVVITVQYCTFALQYHN